MKRQLIHGDSVKELKKFDDNSVDLLCTDPPYGYGFMGRDWDKVLPDINIFKECFRVLKPGSMAFVMSAPRSDVQYRMAEMLEKVGFKIDYTPIYWTYASGFPKAMNIGKMIDKRKGVEREVIGKNPNHRESEALYELGFQGGKGDGNIVGGAVSDEAKKLEGSYGGFQPKPAVEVVIVAMKPLDKKGYLEQAQDNGKGVTWFDDCRIPFADESEQWGNVPADDIRGGNLINDETKNHPTLIKNSSPMGRFPANMLVSDEALNDYSNFFSLDSWFEENLKSLPEPVQQTFPFMIVPKASKSEKNEGLDDFEEQFKAGADFRPNHKEKALKGEDGNPYGRWNKIKNIHPTVKPLTLMNYLVVLGSRKGDVVLEPFAGSGTTALACVSQERDYIAIEREEEYYEIAKARLDKVEQPLKMWEKFSG
jgi:site-specific DNA-methyltransferase (adenine-specific)